jgi:hypothetical protein
LKLDFAAEKGGMAVSAVWRLVYFLAPLPIGTNKHAKAHALCPLLQKIQMQAAFGIRELGAADSIKILTTFKFLLAE